MSITRALTVATFAALLATTSPAGEFVATDGLHWAIGAGQTDPNLAGSLNLPAIYQAQTGLIQDMDFASEQLNKTFAI